MDILARLRMMEVIEGAYERWAEYREAVTLYIIQEAKTFDEVALLGVGRSNDIDLRLLLTRFEKLILIDKDIEAVREGLKQYGLEDHPQITIKQVDLLGVEEADYKAYSEAVDTCFKQGKFELQTEEVVRLLDKIKEKMREYPLVLEEDTYQNVVLLGVHSQLNIYLAHIWALYSEAYQKENLLVYDKIKIMNHLASKKLNTALLQCTKECLFIGYEMYRIEREGRVEGAIQAESDLESREALGMLQIQSEKEVLWPFKSGCTYQMRVLCLKKNKIV